MSLHWPLWLLGPHLFLLSLSWRLAFLFTLTDEENWFRMLLRPIGRSHQVIMMLPDLEGLHLLSSAEVIIAPTEKHKDQWEKWPTFCWGTAHSCFSSSLLPFPKSSSNPHTRARKRQLLPYPLGQKCRWPLILSAVVSSTHILCCLIRVFCIQTHLVVCGFQAFDDSCDTVCLGI